MLKRDNKITVETAEECNKPRGKQPKEQADFTNCGPLDPSDKGFFIPSGKGCDSDEEGHVPWEERARQAQPPPENAPPNNGGGQQNNNQGHNIIEGGSSDV